MTKYTIALITFSFLTAPNLHAQENKTPIYAGAKATEKHYNVVYQLNSGEQKKIEGTLKNIGNALNDPRLKGKVSIELVVHSGGVEVFKQTNSNLYKDKLLSLQKQGVLLVMCENTLKERNVQKKELMPFISYTPSANGELIILQQQGWGIIHP
ncbi:DsrE family protein [Pseudopedobacter beijingensis]|uniref:DsrE family protein n=1 Tax=Pseudopedobacter beijingensis TaxID=1207056 RepID=A0ABW4IHD7_9SPHI